MQELTMSRRSFVKAATVTGAAAALGTQISGAFAEVDKAWAETPSETKMYVSHCRGCIQNCPCRAYVRDGVVAKLEGHPLAPMSMGSMCLKGLSQIHAAYSPLRVLYPLKRTGDRGAENVAWERISWDEALDLAATKFSEAIERYGTYAFFTATGGGGGETGTHARTMDQMLGSPNCIAPGSQTCHMPRVVGAALMYGGADQSIADCKVLEPFKGLAPKEAAKGLASDTKVLVLWGAQPSVSQTAQSGRGMAELRARGCKTVVVDPYMSPDAVKATIWLRIRPGADCAMILSWINYVIENNLIDTEFCKQWTNLPFIIDPDTKLPYYAKELFPDFVQSTPANTPAYVCWDNKTQSLQPFEYASLDVDPEIFWSGEVNGKQCRSAGQVYKEAAEPYTFAKAEEICWVPADLIEKACKLYAEAPVAGIVHGVANDQQVTSSQAPMGLMGLDMMMGYVNKPGAALTQNATSTPKEPPARPTYKPNGPNGTVTNTWELGYVVGASDEENAERLAKLAPGMDPKAQGTLYVFNQMALDRLGAETHRGLNSYSNAHPSATMNALLNGIPYKPRVLYTLTGNMLAMFPNAGAWYDAFRELDFCVAQLPYLTSFHAEFADLVLPTKEWLELPVARTQLNYTFPSNQIIHLGETVSHAVACQKVMNATAKKLNDYLDAGNEVVFGSIGATVGKYPSAVDESDQRATDKNSSAVYECDTSKFEVRFPFGGSVMAGGAQEDSVLQQTLATRFGAPDYPTMLSDLKYQQPDFDDPSDPTFVTDPNIYWVYDQHLQDAKDGLPAGFATESRKCEVYVSIFVKMAMNGHPFAYPRPQDPIDPSTGQEFRDYDPNYEYVGTYSPICAHMEPKESPIEGDPGYDSEYPLVMTCGRVPYFHHGTMRHAPYIRELYPVPNVCIHPNTAEKYGLKHRDWVEISSRRGSTKGRVYATRGMHEKVIWMERFWNPECYDKSQPNKTGGWAECNYNMLSMSSPPYNEVYGSYTLRGFCVNIKPTTKPSNVWVEPKEFQPWMPSNANQYVSETGIAMETDGSSPNVTFNDWDREAATTSGGGGH